MYVDERKLMQLKLMHMHNKLVYCTKHGVTHICMLSSLAYLISNHHGAECFISDDEVFTRYLVQNRPTQCHLKEACIIQKRMVQTNFGKNKIPQLRISELLGWGWDPSLPLLYTHRICLIAHKIFYSSSIQPSHSYNSPKSPYDLPYFTSTSASAARNQLPAGLRKTSSIITFTMVLKRHLLSFLV